MSQSPRVLIADDDRVLVELLSEFLSSEGCVVSQAFDGSQAVDLCREPQFDLVVMDIMMPELNGIEALKQLRGFSAVPVIMLTARGEELDRILGLELGADDYLSKPCNPRELFARIKAVLRRSSSPDTAPKNLELGDLSIFPGSRQALLAGAEITLTQTEFDLLYLLLDKPGQVVGKAEISEKVLGKKLSQWDRSIDVHVSNLRKKTGNHADGQDRIRTIRSSGYLYTKPEARH